MSQIHATSLVENGAVIGKNVEIGPFCHVGANVSIGDGCILKSHVVLKNHQISSKINQNESPESENFFPGVF